MDLKLVITIVLGLLGSAQSLFIYQRTRRDKRQADSLATEEKLHNERRSAMESRMNSVQSELAAHIKEDRDMHERVKGSESKIEGLQQQINDVNSRHGDLVTRIDEIHKSMLTKEDLKMLIEVIRTGK